MIRRHVVAGAALLVAAATLSLSDAAATPGASVLPMPDANALDAISGLPWTWPLAGARVEAPFEAPAHRYGPGHRGMDLSGAATSAVIAPADGVVAFAGSVAGRPLLTIDHGMGLVTTFEPVIPGVVAGRSVVRGEQVGTLAAGGHARPGTLHVGVRRDGEYINPMLLFGSVPRAVLLPCCQRSTATTLRSPESVTSPSAAASTSLSLPSTMTGPTSPRTSISLRSPAMSSEPTDDASMSLPPR